MPDLTPNLNLEKPLDNETADIGVINSNMDKIDTGFGNIQQQIENIDVTGTQITVDQSQAPSLPGNGTIAQLFNWIANRIKAITGKTNWWDTPDITLASAKSHIDAAAPHSGHETPAGAQAKVDAHANATDPHPQYALDTDLNSHAALTSVHGATSTATANTIIMRDASGRAKVAAPSASDDIARKAEVDTKVSKSGDTMTGNLTISGGSLQVGISSGSIGVGDDTIIEDCNVANTIRIKGKQDPTKADIYLGTNNYKVWHSGNDGAGSGLDADMIDTYHAVDITNGITSGKTTDSVYFQIMGV
ncbi:hypothetical protein [Petroclostridium xylanilyticum]|jgi:hypothetical protein|uniref:hypothetical protein n=1 Tax=Petroclostridium xylanilyticum TaxID=1792311 RepID=UPI000B989CEF|nr:hypothetical protein [Petroclostridium xylanilyticum]